MSTTSVTVTDVSAHGAQVLMPGPAEVGSLVRLDLTPFAEQPITAVVRSSRPGRGGHLVGLQFVDMTASARARLVLGLFQTGSTLALAAAA